MASTHDHDFSIGGKMGDSAGARTGEKSSGSKNGPQILQIYYLAPSYMYGEKLLAKPVWNRLFVHLGNATTKELISCT